MEISFSTSGNVQVVEVAGALGDSEAAAVRFKLEQKINQGRSKVLFDLGRYEVTDAAARRLLLGVVSYSITRGALTACSGIQPENWPLMILPGSAPIKILLSKQEGLDYLEKNDLPGASRKAALGKKPTDDKDEIKDGALKDLLAKYEVFQQSDEFDPFRLEFLANQYKVSPNQDALNQERKANGAFTKAADEVKTLETECDNLAGQVKARMLSRKSPLTEKELSLKKTALTNEISENKTAIGNTEKQIRALLEQTKSFENEVLTAKAEMDATLKALQQKINEATAENEELKKNLNPQSPK